MRKNDTLKITTGALFVAIFTIFLLLNRYTGAMFESMLVYLLPIPMVAYSAKFGFKAGIPVMIAMIFMSFIFGTINTIYYAVAEPFVGLVFGAMVNKKVDSTRMLLVVMGLSIVETILSTFVLAGLLGVDLAAELEYFGTYMTQMFDAMEKMGSMKPEALETARSMLTPSFLVKIYIVGCIGVGLLQGFLVYIISYFVLKRMRFHIPKLKNLLEIYPPKWAGLAAIVGLYFTAFEYQKLQETQPATADTFLSVNMVIMMFLTFWGLPMIMLLVRRYITKSTKIGVIAGIIGMFTLSSLMMILGVIYILTDFHRSWMEEEKAAIKKAEENTDSSNLITQYGASTANPHPQNARARKQNSRSSYAPVPGKKSMRDKSNLVQSLTETKEEEKTEEQKTEEQKTEEQKTEEQKTEE